MSTAGDPDLVELAKRRGFFFPAYGAYGGVAGFYTYGPHGAALKRNLEAIWRDRFVTREGHMEVESPDVVPEAVFEASGHLETFDDMIVECPACGTAHRADHLVEDATAVTDAESLGVEAVAELIVDHELACPTCGESLAGEPVEAFNLMFATDIGPGSSQPGYLRPETAQGIFVEFPRLAEYARNQLPFGVAQIGRAYRNEISPRRSLIRVREFTQAELEHFIDPETDEPPLDRVADVALELYPATDQHADDGDHTRATVREAVEEGIIESDWIAFYLGIAQGWYERIGVDMNRFRYRQHLSGERSHYAADCWDAEAEIDGNWIEITGFAYRGEYDLSKHDAYGDEDFTVFRPYEDPRTVERATVDPDMSYLGPEYGERAENIAAALADLAVRDPDAFDGGTVTVSVDDATYDIPVERTGFAVEEVTESGEHVMPHVVEPSFGVGRLVYTVLDHGLRRDEVDGEPRTYLDLAPEVAPTTVGVFPLLSTDPLIDQAGDIAAILRDAGFEVAYDESGNIGRRYRRQDEIGTPFCVTVDHQTLEDETVTVRDRDTTAQERVAIERLAAVLSALHSGDRTVEGSAPVDADRTE